MNSTSFVEHEILFKNSTTTTIESWFILADIFMIICTISAIILATIFIFIVLLDKTCYTVPMMLFTNSCVAELILGSNMFSMAIFALLNDIKQIQYQDSLCTFRGYLGYAAYPLQNYSYALTAVYRYITVVYPTRLFWQSVRIQLLLIGLTWICAFTFPIAFMFTGDIIYNGDNQICQIPIGFSFPIIYGMVYAFIIPIVIIMFIYWKLLVYVKEMSKRVTPTNTLLRAQRELEMIRRIIILVIGVTTIGFPYALIITMSFFTQPIEYHFRIAFIFIDASIVFVIIALYRFTDPLKLSIKKIIRRRSNRIGNRIV